MIKIEVSISAVYGIMFLNDSKVEPVIPVNAGAEPIAHTSTCLAFNVLIYVDGDAKIILCSDSSEEHLREYFSGKIDCPSKSLSLCDTNGFSFASLPLKDDFASISLRMSEEQNPGTVECVVENISAF